MDFLEFVRVIQTEPPQSCYTLDTEPCPRQPILLLQEEIEALVEFAVLNQPMVTLLPQAKTIPMLTLLMSLGTQEKNHTFDKILLEKDPRIEACIIHKALTRAQASSAHAPEKVVFGLSGNPPTLDHLLLIKHLIEKHQRVCLVLNAQSPCKVLEEYVPAEIRLDLLTSMLDAAHLDSECCEVSRVEVDRDPPSRMIATLSLLMLSNPVPFRYVLILGVDALFDFERWYQWWRLADLCDLKVYPRPGLTLNLPLMARVLRHMQESHFHISLVYHTPALKQQYEWVSQQLDTPLTLLEEPVLTSPGSSSQLRRYYALQVSDTPPENIHPVVDKKIRALGLYRHKVL